MTVSLATDETRLPYESMRRLLGRLSAGRQWSVNGAPGGKAELTWEDISRAIARLKLVDGQGNRVPDVLTQALLGYLWGGVIQDRPVVVQELAERLELWAARDGWRKRTNGLGSAAKAAELDSWLQSLAAMALDEIVSRKACKECSAQGSRFQPGGFQTKSWVDDAGVDRIGRIWIKGHWAPCEACRGQGVHPWSKARRAQTMGVHRSSWEIWDPRYLDLLMFIDRRDQRGLRKLRRVLG